MSLTAYATSMATLPDNRVIVFPIVQGVICIAFFPAGWSVQRPAPCDSSSIGRASASQAEGYGIVPRLSLRGELAQWLAQEAYTFKVNGSSPLLPTKIKYI